MAKIDQVTGVERLVGRRDQLVRVHIVGDDLASRAIPSDPFPFVLLLNFQRDVFGRRCGFSRQVWSPIRGTSN